MSAHFDDAMLIHSDVAVQRGIDNFPPSDVQTQLQFTAAGLERIQAILGFDLKILSGYRCEALNAAVGGSKNSQHIKGEAIDFICPAFGKPKDVAGFLFHWMHVLGIDQLLLENTWVHVSFTLNPRFQALTKIDDKYVFGILSSVRFLISKSRVCFCRSRMFQIGKIAM